MNINNWQQPFYGQPQQQKEYRLFISHSWDYGVDRTGLWDLLIQNFFPHEFISDSSAPRDHPIHSMGDKDLINALVDLIRNVGLLIVPAGVYATHSKWIQIEMAIAQQLGVPILAIYKYGAERSSAVAVQGANATVHWNG